MSCGRGPVMRGAARPASLAPQISVASGGPGFVVTIRGGDDDSGRQILLLSRIDELAAAAAFVGAP